MEENVSIGVYVFFRTDSLGATQDDAHMYCTSQQAGSQCREVAALVLCLGIRSCDGTDLRVMPPAQVITHLQVAAQEFDVHACIEVHQRLYARLGTNANVPVTAFA